MDNTTAAQPDDALIFQIIFPDIVSKILRSNKTFDAVFSRLHKHAVTCQSGDNAIKLIADMLA